MVVVADGRLARQTHRHTVLLKLTLQTDAFDAVVRHAVVFGVRLEELRFDGGEKGLTRHFNSTQLKLFSTSPWPRRSDDEKDSDTCH